MRRYASMSVSLVLALLASACMATSRPNVPPQGDLVVLAVECDSACYMQNREAFLKQLEQRRDRNLGGETPNRTSFRRWSATGIITGLVGGILGLAIGNEETAAAVASGTSLATGAITAWLATTKYETQAANYAACVTAANAAIETFRSSWDETNLPPKDNGAADDYRSVKQSLTTQLNEICPR